MGKNTKTTSWEKLVFHSLRAKTWKLKNICKNTERINNFKVRHEHLYFNYNRNIIDSQIQNIFSDLLNERNFDTMRKKLFEGGILNPSENRQAMHPVLRIPSEKLGQGNKTYNDVLKDRDQVLGFVENFYDPNSLDFLSRKNIEHIVNIGIGGSDLGPRLSTKALESFHMPNAPKIHFLSNPDPEHFNKVIKSIFLEKTLFIVTSKSFKTQETFWHVSRIQELLQASLNTTEAKNNHFVAVTGNTQEALKLGIPEKYIFPVQDWTGGRYSIWSAVGLPLALSIGKNNFLKFLSGACSMDEHFLTAPNKNNIPVILASLAVWYNNFFAANAQAVISYTSELENLPEYLQQLAMESNGKRTDKNGNPVHHQTGQIIFGGTGTRSQHSFFQLLHHGTKFTPVDFIGIMRDPADDQYDTLLTNMLAQSEALANGLTFEEVQSELRRSGLSEVIINESLPHRVFPGNIPSNIIFLNKMAPENLGALLAMYEHKVFTEGIICNINSFDQWGVELGKHLADKTQANLNDMRKTGNIDKSNSPENTDILKDYFNQ
jgi:glucose-6-phosphate isomerase